jgi:hypothetical protein
VADEKKKTLAPTTEIGTNALLLARSRKKGRRIPPVTVMVAHWESGEMLLKKYSNSKGTECVQPQRDVQRAESALRTIHWPFAENAPNKNFHATVTSRYSSVVILGSL